MQPVSASASATNLPVPNPSGSRVSTKELTGPVSIRESGSMTSLNPPSTASQMNNNNNNSQYQQNNNLTTEKEEPSTMTLRSREVVLPDKERIITDYESPFSVSMADSLDQREYSILAKCAAEFLCTLIFVFVGSMQAQVGAHDGNLHAALAHGVAIFVLASAFGGISGAHINPAITMAVCAVGKMSPIQGICYMISQLSGGFVGSCLVRALLSEASYVLIQGGATLCGTGVEWYQGLLAEVITTFMLVQTVLMTAVDTDKNILAPLAIGLTLTIDILSAGNISGASMNPARSFGPNVAGSIFMGASQLNSHFWSYHWIYYVGPLAGAFIAAAVYRTFFSRENRAFP